MMPKTIFGRVSLVLAAANILVTAVSLVLVGRGDLGTNDNPANTWIGGVSGILAMLALVTGAIAIIRSKERAKLLYIALALILVLFLAGEFLFPH